MALFDDAHEIVAFVEGGYCNHPNDPGGPTKHGCSQAFLTDFARNAARREFLRGLGVAAPVTADTIRGLTKGQVKEIFRNWFWDAPGLERLPWNVAIFCYDAGVNHGQKVGIKMMQRAARLADATLADDGIIGPKTLAAVEATRAWLFGECMIARRDYYNAIIRKDRKKEVFRNGWANRLKYLEENVLRLARKYNG